MELLILKGTSTLGRKYVFFCNFVSYQIGALKRSLKYE